MKIEDVKSYLINFNLPIKKIVFSDRLNGNFSKIVLRPVEIKGQSVFQVESFKGSQVFHSNLSFKDAVESVQFKDFKQIWLKQKAKQYPFQFQKMALKRKSKQQHNASKNFNRAQQNKKLFAK